MTWTPDDRQTFDLSVNVRRETDVRDFGRNTAFTAATLLENEVDTYLLRHTYRGGSFVNEAAISLLDYSYRPTRLSDEPTFEYQGYITVGGAASARDVEQKTFTVRNDLTFDEVKFHGDHIIKVGVRYARQNYGITTELYAQPFFNYREPDLGIPYLANLGVGDPSIEASNWQLGLYVQDDWRITDRLELNLGLRWDYEDDQFNNDFVTPANIAGALRGLPKTFYYTDPDRFISDGDERDPDLTQFQPRLGFSYDVGDDQRTVLFGGYGRYYDRNVFSNTLNERYRLQYNVATVFFSRDGSVNDLGQPTVVFDERYLTREGLESLQATTTNALSEVFVVKNDAQPPQSDQFTLGVRQRFGQFYTSAALTHIRGKHGLTSIFINRDTVTGDCCVPTPENFGFITALVDDLKTRYTGLYATVDKPYSESSGWGFSAAYTLAKAEQNGDPSIYGAGGFQSYNCLSPDDCGFNPRPFDARHTLVLSGQLKLPFGLRASTLTTLSTPTPYLYEDYTNGFSYSTQQIDFDRLRQKSNCLDVFSRCTVDIKVQKAIAVGAGELNLVLDVFNLFNNKNYGAYDGYIGFGGEPSSTFGQPLDLATRPRSLQLGASYRF